MEKKKKVKNHRRNQRRQSTGLMDHIIHKAWHSAIHFARSPVGSREARTRDVAGCVPLHRACALMAPHEVTKALLDVFPDALTLADTHGKLPLHHACSSRRASPAVIRTLLRTYSSAAAIADNSGRLPLHHACARGASVEIPQVLLASYPDAACYQDNTGRIPLHYTCSCSCYDGVEGGTARTDAALLLLQSYPQGATIMDREGSLPLHYACSEIAGSRFTPPEVVKALIKAYPPAASKLNGDGLLPLHCVCLRGTGNGLWTTTTVHACTLVVRYLLQAFPMAASIPYPHSSRNCLPLHCACSMGCAAAVVKELVQAFPASVRFKDNQGNLPLHLCMQGRTEEEEEDEEESEEVYFQKAVRKEVIVVLLDAYPDAARIGDRMGRTWSFLVCEEWLGTS